MRNLFALWIVGVGVPSMVEGFPVDILRSWGKMLSHRSRQFVIGAVGHEADGVLQRRVRMYGWLSACSPLLTGCSCLPGVREHREN